MLLLARRDFLKRLEQAMRDRHEDLPMPCTLLPFIDLTGTRSTEIARRIGVSKQAMAKAVKALEGTGLVMREPDETDARAFRVRFTPDGLRYMMKMHDAVAQVEADYIKLLGAAQIKALRQALLAMAYGNNPSSSDEEHEVWS